MITKYESGVLNRPFITASVMLSAVMQALDTTIANVALPHMQGTLSATQDQISWVLTSYIVAAAIATPLTGFVAGKFGRKKIFMLSIAGFTLTSMLCGAAGTLTEMVLFRLLQGIFGASLIPLSQSVLLDSYPSDKHGMAMAVWGIGVMIGPILGPTLGGYLTDYYNWRWVFYINIPFGVLALLGIFTFVPETPLLSKRHFDMFGFALLSISIGALQLMLDRGQTKDWFNSLEIITETVACGLCFYMFVVHIFTSKNPFVEPDLFKDRNFSLGLVFIFVIGVILLATLALMPPYLQQLMNYPVLKIGYVLAPRGIGSMLAMMLVGKLINKVDVRYMIFLGVILLAYSLWEMANFNTLIDPAVIVQSGFIQGIGLGFTFTPVSTIAFATLSSHYRNEGTAMFSLMRNLGSSVGISIVTTLFIQNTQYFHAQLAANITPYNPLLQNHPALDLSNLPQLAFLENEMSRQASMVSYVRDFRFMMLMIICALPFIFLLKPIQRQPFKKSEKTKLEMA